jgi:hypothetical protein
MIEQNMELKRFAGAKSKRPCFCSSSDVGIETRSRTVDGYGSSGPLVEDCGLLLCVVTAAQAKTGRCRSPSMGSANSGAAAVEIALEALRISASRIQRL